MTFRFDSVARRRSGNLWSSGSEKSGARTPDSLRVIKDVDAVKYIVSKQDVIARVS
jgi:hypothetical protein